MTREEAIKTLKGEAWSFGSKEYREAFDMAIKALEQEPTTKNDLGVDTDKLIADCEKMSFDFELFGRPTKALLLDAVKNIVKHLPSVTPQEPKTGHWKLVQRGKFIDVCCSNCEAVRIKDYAYNYTIDQLNKEDLKEDLKECFECADMRYCPNCGAKMESEG